MRGKLARTAWSTPRLAAKSSASRRPRLFTLAAERETICGNLDDEHYDEHENDQMWRSAERPTTHKDDVFYIDKDGVPHWDGTDPAKYLKQYKARVMIEYETTIGDSEVAQERRQNLALRLTRGLTGRLGTSWSRCWRT